MDSFDRCEITMSSGQLELCHKLARLRKLHQHKKIPAVQTAFKQLNRLGSVFSREATFQASMLGTLVFNWNDHSFIAFNAQDESFLKGAAQAIEEAISKTPYWIERSPDLEELITRRIKGAHKGLSHFKKLANAVIETTAHLSVIMGMQTYAKLTGNTSPMTIAYVEKTVLIFNMNETAAIELVRNSVVPVAKPLPRKTVTRMLHKRMKEFMQGVKRHNGPQELIQVNTGKYSTVPQSNPIFDTPTEARREAWLEYLNVWVPNNKKFHQSFRWLTEGLKKVISRAEVDDEMIEQVMKIITIGEVMDS